MPSSDDRAARATEDWARSGAMALTGYRDGPPLAARGAAATSVAAALADLSLTEIVGVELLGERAALRGATRRAPWSVGGAFRILPAADGWLGVSMPRPDDLAAVPALVEGIVDEPWDAVTRWAARTCVDVALERAHLLGLPISAVPIVVPPAHRPGVLTTDGGARPEQVGPPLVVDFSSLWAGPLCANLLGLSGCDVVKIESITRPDGARRGDPRFFDLLHTGHRAVALDFRLESHLEALRALVAQADVVIEASRPRALRALGLDAERAVDAGTIWVSITAYGRAPAQEHRVGFGDDVAAGAGLVAFDDDTPLPAGDALADPLTGVHAAAAATRALSGTFGQLIDVSMHDVSRAAAALPSAGVTDAAVAPPAARPGRGRAPAVGQHTAEVANVCRRAVT